MICYKDQTFCADSAEGRCVNKDCWRFYGQEQRAEAKRWWGGDGAPVAFANFADGCPDFISFGEKR